MPARASTPENCPVCGESVPRGAKACPHCGADERAGWDEEATRYDGLDLPEEAFAGDEEAAASRSRRPAVPRIVLIVVAVLALIAVLIRFSRF